MSKHYERVITLLVAFFMSVFPLVAAAKSINMYDQPKTDAKVVGTLDPEVGIMTIYTPKGSDWVKVADPRDGNVGWVKSSDLGNARINFSVINSGDGSHGYQFFQYNGQPYTQEELSKAMQKMQTRQQAIQNDMQKMMQDMITNMHQQWMNFPMIMPVVVVPVKAVSPAATTVKPAADKK